MQVPGRVAAEEAAGRDMLAADLRCSLFAAALHSYKRDSALRPFPASYSRGDCKDFEALLADASRLPGLKELLSSGDKDQRVWDLVSWVLSSKILTIHSTGKAEFEKIQQLTGAPHTPVPVPDFLFEIEYFNPANAKFYETKGERDLIYAFHGSRLENFHSIIHNGLHCHLNKTSLFGEGTYLTSDLSLALIYSPHGHGWQHSLLGPILSCVAVCEVIDHPDVKCQTKKKDSKEIDRRRARIKHSEGGDIPPKYFVVTNNQLLRVKYLLVYSQKQPKRASSQLSWFSSHWFMVMMSLYLLLLLSRDVAEPWVCSCSSYEAALTVASATSTMLLAFWTECATEPCTALPPGASWSRGRSLALWSPTSSTCWVSALIDSCPSGGGIFRRDKIIFL